MKYTALLLAGTAALAMMGAAAHADEENELGEGPIKHVLLDNHALGKISKEQLAEDYPVWHTSLHNPDWAGYAQLCGATGIRVISRDQLDEAMTTLFASDGPALLHIEQDAELL